MATEFQQQFNADINAIMNEPFMESFIHVASGTTFDAQFTLLRSDPATEYPTGDNSNQVGEARWQESDFSGAKPMDRFLRVDTGDYWYIPQNTSPEVDGFGEVIAQFVKLDKNLTGAR